MLVIDDLHELQSADALAALERFLADVPVQLRVVLLTRGNPGLGLHRLRLAGALTELRGADLRFSLPETHELLTASGIALSDGGTAVLHERTEGWAAGLRLATISLSAHPDPERFAAEFCGSERTVAAFLKAEVLDRQPPEVRELLLRTSVLERVNGPLAAALTGGSGSLRILQELEEADAFVTAVDVGRSCFRYHPMFADLLRLELRRIDPALVGTLHRAAARWFELHGHPVEAIRHAQSAGDWVYAGRLLADHQLGLTLDGRGAEVRALLAAFPPDAPAADAELALAVATTSSPTPCMRRPPPISPSPSTWLRRWTPIGGRHLTSRWPRPRSGWRVPVPMSVPCRPRRAPSKRRWRPSPRASSGAPRPTGRPRSSISAPPSCGLCGWTKRKTISTRRSSSPAGSSGPPSRSRACPFSGSWARSAVAQPPSVAR